MVRFLVSFLLPNKVDLKFSCFLHLLLALAKVVGAELFGGSQDLGSGVPWRYLVFPLSGTLVSSPPRVGFFGVVPLLSEPLVGKLDDAFIFKDVCVHVFGAAGFPLWENGGAPRISSVKNLLDGKPVYTEDFRSSATRKFKSGLQSVKGQIDAHMCAHLCAGICWLIAAAHDIATGYARMATTWSYLLMRLQLEAPGFGIVICLFLLDSKWLASSYIMSTSTDVKREMCRFYCLLIYMRIHQRVLAIMVVVGNPGDEGCKIQFEACLQIYHKTSTSLGEVKLNDLRCFSCTCLSLSHDHHVEDAVPMLFGLCHRRWMTTPPLLIPRFNSGDALRLSSVKAIRDLQLNPIPRVHIPDRPTGEPPAGHQLDCIFIEALEDRRCGNIESELSTDERSPCGSICDLQHLLHEFRSSFCYVVQLGTYFSCSIESHVMLYLDP